MRNCAAQVLRIVDGGNPAQHLDTHKHTHLAPPVLDAVARLAEEFDIRWVRRPFDFPLNALRGAVPWMKRWTSDALGLMRRRFHRVLARHGCRTTDHFAGFQITGRFRTEELVRLMGVIPEGSTELMCHPGHCGDALRHARTRLKESRVRELEALVAPETRQAMERHGIELVNYRSLDGTCARILMMPGTPLRCRHAHREPGGHDLPGGPHPGRGRPDRVRGHAANAQAVGSLRNPEARHQLHEHNEAERTAELIERLNGGTTIALVTDAGTPLVSDPGYRLVKAAVENRITVYPIPGASAAMTALAASGLPTDSFHFGGFLPPKPGQRLNALKALSEEQSTLIFYEAPHRILESLEAVEEALGPRPVVVARELTKLHEEFLRGTAAEIRAQLAARDSVKGEITLLIGKATAPPPDDTPIVDAVAALVRAGTPRMDAIKQVARRRGMSKREVYDQLL